MKTLSLMLTLIVVAACVPAMGQVQPDEPAAHQMQGLMDKIESTKDPAERRRLLDQHRAAMHAQMQALKTMTCAAQVQPGEHAHGNGGMMMGGAGMMKCHESMQARMDMMLGLMEQMMRHDEAEHGKR